MAPAGARRRIVVGTIVGACFLVGAFWGVPISELADAFRGMRKLDLLWVAGVFLLQQGVRGVRQYWLVAPLAPGTTLWRQHAILCIGFFFVNTLPARLGEIARPYLLRELDGVPLGAGAGVVVAERAIDLIMLFCALGIAITWGNLVTVESPLGDGRIDLGELTRRAAWVALPVLAGALIAVGVLGPRVSRPIESFGERLAARLGANWIARGAAGIASLAESFSAGLRSIGHPRRLLGVLLLTALAGFLMAETVVVAAHAFGLGEQIGLAEGLGVAGVTMLGIALPAPPGFVGVYEGSVRLGLAFFGVSGGDLDGPALAIALVLHWWLYLVQAGSAGISFWTEREGVLRALDHARRARADQA